jgi:Mg-chelatase subunit ChlD
MSKRSSTPPKTIPVFVAPEHRAPSAAPAEGSRELPWWGYRDVQRRLAALLSTLGGGRGFRLEVRESGMSFTDFDRKRVVVDPTIVTSDDPALHLLYTKGVIAHEAGHVRFTTPAYGLKTTDMGSVKTQVLAQLCNILEDERVDRAMANSHWGMEAPLQIRKRALWEQRLTPLDPSKSEPEEVLSAIIQLRYGWELKGSLSPENQARLELVRPLVVAAWNAPDTETVRGYAEQVMKLLGLEERAEEAQKKLDEQGCGDGCPSAIIIGRPDDADANPNASHQPGGRCDKDGEPGHACGGSVIYLDPNAPEGSGAPISDDLRDQIEQALKDADIELSSVFGRGGEQERSSSLRPAAVDAQLYAAAKAAGTVLARGLRAAPPVPRSRADADGSRFSYRDELRNADRPMRRRDVPTKKRKVAITALVDCSGSMSGAMPEVRRAVLSADIAAREIGIPFSVYGFSSWREGAVRVVRPDRLSGRTAPEAIAGLEASGGTILAPALTAAADDLRRTPAERKILLVIHDGQPSDMEESAAAAHAAARRGMEVIGIYLGDESRDAEGVEAMRALFGRRLLTAADAAALAPLLAGFVRRALRPAQV